MTDNRIRIYRYTGSCPGCGAGRSIVRKLAEKVAFCEACGRGYTVDYLDALLGGTASMTLAVGKPPLGKAG